jgi:hypothetical protein
VRELAASIPDRATFTKGLAAAASFFHDFAELATAAERRFHDACVAVPTRRLGARYLGGKIPFGFRLCESGELDAHEGEQEAIREMIALRARGKPLRAIADAVRAKGYQISHEGVAGVLRAAGSAR